MADSSEKINQTHPILMEQMEQMEQMLQKLQTQNQPKPITTETAPQTVRIAQRLH